MNRTTQFASLAALVVGAPIALAQDLPESSPQALMHHAQGIAEYVKANNAGAVAHFRMAIAADPTSYASMFMAGVAASNAGNGTLADSFYTAVAAHKDQLSPYYRYRLEAQVAGRAGDITTLIALNKKAAALGEGTKAWYNIAQAGVGRNPTEARDALRKLDPEREPMKGWYSYYTVYQSSAHLLGDYDDALKMAQRERVAFPEDNRALADEAEQLAALGRVAEVESRLAEIDKGGNRTGFTVIGAHNTIGQELMAHGNVAAGTRALEGGLKFFDALPADSQKTINNREARAYALYSLGRFKELPAIYSAVSADAPTNQGWKAWVGYTSGLAGDKAKAMEVAQKIESKEINLGANTLIWRALIATSVGDRERGLALFRESGVRAIWMHRDPVVSKAHGAQWVAFLKN